MHLRPDHVTIQPASSAMKRNGSRRSSIGQFQLIVLALRLGRFSRGKRHAPHGFLAVSHGKVMSGRGRGQTRTPTLGQFLDASITIQLAYTAHTQSTLLRFWIIRSICVACKASGHVSSGVRKRKSRTTPSASQSRSEKKPKHEFSTDDRKRRHDPTQRLPPDKLKRTHSRLVKKGDASIDAYSKMSGNHAFWGYWKDDKLHIHSSLDAVHSVLRANELELTQAAAQQAVWQGEAVARPSVALMSEASEVCSHYIRAVSCVQ